MAQDLNNVTEMPLGAESPTVEEALQQPEDRVILMIVRGLPLRDHPDLPFVEGETMRDWRIRRHQQIEDLMAPEVGPRIEKAKATGAKILNASTITGTIVCEGPPKVLRALLDAFGVGNIVVDAFRD